ncbi:MAG: hypothetical protein ACRD3R_12310, partial [Terriglobales bacterium]
MVKRIAAIVFIFLCTTVAWAILGGTVFSRTYASGAELHGRVAATWGAPHTASPPAASYSYASKRVVTSLEDGKKVERVVDETTPVELPLESSKLAVALDLEHRQKGLLWYSVYKVAFQGEYGFRNTSAREEEVT